MPLSRAALLSKAENIIENFDDSSGYAFEVAQLMEGKPVVIEFTYPHLLEQSPVLAPELVSTTNPEPT